MENKNLVVEVAEEILNAFISIFNRKIVKTVFAGAELREIDRIERWNERSQIREVMVQMELVSGLMSFLEIPGHEFLGMVKFEEGEKFISSFRAETDWQSILPQVEATRCDVCNVKHSRSNVFCLTETETSKLVVVGGSCSKKFKTINLEDLLFNTFKSFDKLISDCFEDSEYASARAFRDLAREIAIGEGFISREGYVSKKRADEETILSTADCIVDAVKEGLTKFFSKEEIEIINARAKELSETSFAEHIAYFEAKIQKRWNEFDSNCLSTLKAASGKRTGITAYLANVRFAKVAEAKTANVVTKPLSITGEKMTDMGEFTVLNKKVADTNYGSYVGVLAINEDNEKVWFKVGFNSASIDNCTAASVGMKVALRGKVKEHKADMSFLTGVKILKVI